MRAPGFWSQRKPSALARMLAPVGWIFGTTTTRRFRQAGTPLPVPVICIGNFVAGGAGKTPVVLAAADLLRRAGESPALLSRGYGRDSVRGPSADDVIRVDPLRHDARRVGDEPLLLAATAPTYVSRDRVAAGRRAIADGASVLVLDDGLQNPSLAKSRGLAVVDGATGIGNGLCIPAGPLRAPLDAQWALVSAVCVIGTGEPGADVARMARERGRAAWTARMVPDPEAVSSLRNRPLFAFAGIGRPEKFYATLAEAGLDVRARRDFADHHAYTREDLERLQADAARLGAQLVTTAKDRVKLPERFPVATVVARLAIDQEHALVAWLADAITEGVGSEKPFNPRRDP